MANISFYIAKRYLIAKKGSTAVSFITRLAVFAVAIATASMLIILSIFSGLEELNRELITNLHADLSISDKKEKQLSNADEIIKILKKQPEIVAFSKTIDEKVYVSYNGVGEIGYLRAVDSAYTKVNPIDKSIYYGTYPNFNYSNEGIIEISLDNRLAISIGQNQFPAIIFMPKPGVGIINSEDDIFTKKEIYLTGVFPGNDQLNNYIITPLEFGQQILNLPKNTAYKIVIKLKNPEDAANVKQKLQQSIGNQNQIKTKNEENKAFWKMINAEKLMIYLIFALVIFITTFNLAGAIIILRLDKQKQAKSLISLGINSKQLENVYFYTGSLIVVLGSFIGLVMGSVICYIQMQTGFFRASPDLPFPVKININNYLVVAAVTLFFGISISWFFSKVKKEVI